MDTNIRRKVCRVCLSGNNKKEFGCCVDHFADLSQEDKNECVRSHRCLICNKKLSIYNEGAICNSHVAESGSPSFEAQLESAKNYPPVGSSRYAK